MITKGMRVRVSPSFPPEKARINNLVVGEEGTVAEVFHMRVGNVIALVKWDKVIQTSANMCDLERI